MKKAKLLFKRLDYIKKHFFIILPHLTLKRAINLIINEFERRLAINTPKSLPPFIKIEPTPSCQLRCTGCAQAKPDFRKQFNKGMHLTLENLKKIIDPISDTLLGISLSLYGEPLLNKDLISFVEYIKSKNIGVSFPTNFSIKLSEEQMERIVKSKLNSIIISLDGASKETYCKYRVGGNFDLVLKNVKLLSDTKKKFESKLPKIVWKFIIFGYNKHETEIVRNTYRSLGFDSYELVYDIWGASSSTAKTLYSKRIFKNTKPCYWLWNTMIIRWNGSVKPCCDYAIGTEFNLGNVLEENIKSIWQGEKYKALRNGFAKKNYGQRMHPVCRKCIGLQALV